MTRGFAVLLAPVLLFAGEGCSYPVGACEHRYEDPVLQLTRVQTPEGPLASVRIADLSLDGRPVGSLQPFAAAPSFGTSLVAGEIVCTLRCGFGVEEGTYSFIARADGYAPKAVTVVAKFSGVDGGCPSRSFGSTAFEFSMQAP